MPFLGRPILWYGFLFALGFFLGYLVFTELLKHVPEKSVKTQAKFLAEKLSLYVIIGTIVGARLGDVFFYQHPTTYLHDLSSIFKVWEGGLASHGGAIGILIALGLFARRYRMLTWIQWLDLLVIPVGLVGFFIRIGNFINQEILGTVTTVPWAVVFGHPADGSVPAPRHPVQLYEAMFYLCVFVSLFFLHRNKKLRTGQLSGIFLVLVFLFRFFVEYWKEEQSSLLNPCSGLDMGQLLSLPFLGLGFYLLLRRK
jgi:prolipoprotein diacylglyceryl transferase